MTESEEKEAERALHQPTHTSIPLRTLLGHCAGLFPMAPVVSTPSLSYNIGISSGSVGGEKEEEKDCAGDEEEEEEEAPLPRPRSRRFSLLLLPPPPPPLRWADKGPIAIGWGKGSQLVVVKTAGAGHE